MVSNLRASAILGPYEGVLGVTPGYFSTPEAQADFERQIPHGTVGVMTDLRILTFSGGAVLVQIVVKPSLDGVCHDYPPAHIVNGQLEGVAGMLLERYVHGE